MAKLQRLFLGFLLVLLTPELMGYQLIITPGHVTGLALHSLATVFAPTNDIITDHKTRVRVGLKFSYNIATTIII